MQAWIHKGTVNRRATTQEQLDALLSDGWEVGVYIDPIKKAELSAKKREAAKRQHASRTEEQKQAVADKIKTTLLQKSNSEKRRATESRLKTRADWTNEKKQSNSESISHGKASMTDRQKAERLVKFRETLRSRSDESTQQWKQHIKDSVTKHYRQMSVEDRQAIADKTKSAYSTLSDTAKQIRASRIQTTLKRIMLNKYGVDNSMKIPAVRSKVAKSSKESSLEKQMREFLSNNNFDFEQHYVIKKDNFIHEFDFAVFKNAELEMLIDCDGLYYHGYLDDVNGKSVNSYTDNYRGTLVPGNVKFIVCVEGEQELAYREILSAIDIDYDSYIESIFNWCRETEFPYPENNERLALTSYNSLVKADPLRFNMYARYGEKALLSQHKSIWQANKEGCLSPYAAWNDDELLKSMIKNRVVYKGSNLRREDMLRAFSVTRKAPRVSIFNPYLAKYLTAKYLSEFSTVFDPCSGYSGRMLGVCSSGKHYVGQDINNVTVSEAAALRNLLLLDADTSVKDSLQSSGTYSALLTCPPYNLKERWGQDIENKSCDEWVTAFLDRYKCSRYVFVVDKTEKYKDHIAENLENKSHLGTNCEYVLVF